MTYITIDTINYLPEFYENHSIHIVRNLFTFNDWLRSRDDNRKNVPANI